MRFAVRHFILGLVMTLCFAGTASAQYLKITTDNPTDNTRMRASGTTVLTITLDTNHDRNGSLQTCNSHTSANCGAPVVDKPIDMFSYTIAMKAVGGTVTWGTFSAADANFTDTSPQVQNDTEVEINKARPTGTFSGPGLVVLGTIPVTPVSGTPGVQLQIGAGALNPFGFGTGFGTSCDAFTFGNTYVVGDPTDPCGNVIGFAGDWFDWDGALSASGNTPPSITAPATATGAEGTAITPIVATATDPETGQTLTITAGTLPSFLTLTTTPGTSPNTGTVTGTPGFGDAGTYNINWSVSDGTDTGNTTTVLTIANTDRAPTLTQPANMTVNEGSTAEQTITGSDPDGDALSFLIVSGPPFMTVLTDTPTSGTIRLVPGFTTSGTYSATVRAFDGTLFNDKTFTITVNNVDRAPTLVQPTSMIVDAGTTADQTLNATDPDGDPLTFTKDSGPTFMTVTTTSPGTGSATGNIHLAPGAADAGTYSVTVGVTDGSMTDSQTFTITVNGGATNQQPTLNAIADMTVTEGATADQVITGSDPDADPLTFAKVQGPVFMTVTTTNATSGTIHLAPGAGTAGTYNASASASDGTLSDTKSFTITVNPVVSGNNPPVLTQPNDMTVAEGATADQSVTATDQDGNPISFSLVSGPSFASVTTTTAGTGTGTGNIHLAPGFSDAGTYSATVRADDGAGGTNDKTLTITVTNVNRAPVLNAIAPMTVTENATADQTISGTDPDGDPLTFTKVTGPTFVTITTATATTGTVHVAPGIGDAGTYTVQAQVSDGTLTDTEIFQVTVNPFVAGNNPPVLTQPSDMTVAEGATADQSITATDQDGNPISFSLVTGPTFATVTTTTAGTGTGTGNIHLAPGFSDAGTYTATVRADDGAGGTNDKTITITVTNTNQAPTLNTIADMTVTEGATADQTITGSDPDGDPLTFTKATGPAFMSVITTNATSGTIHLAPGTGTAGTYSASVTASDGDMSDTKSFTITVNPSQGGNQAPVLTQPADMTVNEGDTADQTLTATDADGNALSFSKVVGPTFMTVSTTSPGTGTGTGNIHLAPGFADAGTYTATVRVDDGNGGTDDKTFTITVLNVNRAPVADAGGPYTGIVGLAVSFNGTGSSDPDGDPLTYSWDFDSTDGIQADATGVSPSHTYTVAGTYTVTLTVSDGLLSDTDTATATISASGGFQASASVDGGDKVIRLQANKPFWCVDITPVDDSFQISDIIPSSVVLTYNGNSIPSASRRIVSEEGDHNAEICFSKEDLRTLFGDLGNGLTDVTVVITGDLQGGGSFVASLDVVVQKTGGPNAASKNGNGHKAFAWASPNPLNPNTVISFALSQPGSVRLNVYDISGRLVKALANQFMDAGVHDVRWDGTTRAGTRVASGVYFYVLQTAEGTVKSQLVVAK